MGIISSIPLGVAGVVCIRETVTHGRYRGLSVGFGAACGEALCALVSVLGVPYAFFWRQYARWLNMLMGMVLLGVAIKSLKYPKPQSLVLLGNTVSTQKDTLHTRLCVTAFLLIMTNPLSILGMVALIGALDIQVHSWFSLINVLLGVFLGALSWWIGMVWGVKSLGKTFQ